MQNFVFRNPVKILFGKGQIVSINKEIPAGAKVMIAYGGGSVLKNGTMDQVRAALNGYSIIEFGGIEPNPTYETLMKAVDIACKEKVDFILAVGGGSVVDGSKFIAAAVPFEGDCWKLLSERAPTTTAIPLGVVITLPATGSEMNNCAVISKAATKDKLAFRSQFTYPQFSVLDPEVTFSLPPRQIANGVVDTFIHTTEQYLTYPVNAPLQDRFAEGILLTLIEEGPKTLANPNDYDSRASLMWCATMALNDIFSVGTPQDWSTHRISHEITALYGLDHAQALAVVLPSLLRVCKDDKREKLLQYARRVWKIEDRNEDVAIEKAIVKTAEFFESLGVKTKIKDYGVPYDVDAVVAQLERHKMTALGERGNVTLDVSRTILNAI